MQAIPIFRLDDLVLKRYARNRNCPKKEIMKQFVAVENICHIDKSLSLTNIVFERP